MDDLPADASFCLKKPSSTETSKVDIETSAQKAPIAPSETEYRELTSAGEASLYTSQIFAQFEGKKPSHRPCRDPVWQGSKNNFIRNCRWSPDGACLLVNSDDNVLRLFALAQLYDGGELMAGVPDFRPGGAVRCTEWYPGMIAGCDASACCFLASTVDHPLRLWNAYSGEVTASYRSYDQVDEIASPFAIGWTKDGANIYCCLEGTIHVFDTTRPGRDYYEVSTAPREKRKRSRQSGGGSSGQSGLLSCIAFSPDFSGMYAVGSFSRSIGLYQHGYESNGPLCLLENAHEDGVTGLSFSPDGNFLYSGARKDGRIHCWDIRNTNSVLWSADRVVSNNQRIDFDVHMSGKYLVTGSQDGNIKLINTMDGQLANSWSTGSAAEPVSGAYFDPTGQSPYIVSTHGSRHFCIEGDDDDAIHGELDRLSFWSFSS